MTPNPGYVSPAKTVSSGGEHRPIKYQNIQPQTQAPLDSPCYPHITMTDDLSSLFDFDLPLTPDVKKPRLSKEPSLGRIETWNMYPASPPNSALHPNDHWRTFDQYQQMPYNILTQIDPARARSHYGQTTPPDDEQLDNLESELTLQDCEVDDLADDSHDVIASSAVPLKRSRKSGGRSKAGPVDPNNPEDIRRSKFLERNRVAASKCRQKKKEWTNNLESRARDLQRENTSLHHIVDSCREEILYLKGEILRHGACKEKDDLQAVLQLGTQPFGKLVGSEVKQESRPHSTASTRVGSPSDHAHPKPMDYSRERSRTYSEELKEAKQSSTSDQSLEMLLTSRLMHDTSAEGIAQRLEM